MRHLLLGMAVLVMHVQAGAGQAVAADTLRPTRSPVGSIWRSVLQFYASGRDRTEADILKQSSSATGVNVGRWRKGTHPKVLALTVEGTTAVIDTSWARQAVTDSLVDAFCGDPFDQCPGEYVTLFLQLSLPVSAGSEGVDVRVSERALSPAKCREEPGTFTGFMGKVFRLQQRDSVWTVVGRQLDVSGSGPCIRDR